MRAGETYARVCRVVNQMQASAFSSGGRGGTSSASFSSSARPWRVVNQRPGSAFRGGGGPDGNGILYAIIGSNVLVYLAWNYDDADFRQRNWMVENFTMSGRGVLSQGHYHTLVTHFFSHRDTMHLFFNMFTLYFFGETALAMLGPQRFLLLYMGGGLASAAATLFAVPFVRNAFKPSPFNEMMPRPGWGLIERVQQHSRNLGASGAVNAVVAWGILANPYARIMIFPIPLPIPAWIVGLGFIGWDSFSVLNRPQSSTGHGAHLGGAVYGGLLYLLFRR